MGTPQRPWQVVPVFHNAFEEEIFLHIEADHPLAQFEAVSSRTGEDILLSPFQTQQFLDSLSFRDRTFFPPQLQSGQASALCLP